MIRLFHTKIGFYRIYPSGFYVDPENQLFSSVLEESVSNRQVCLMAHASLAFSALVCAGFVSAVPALLCLAWFVVSLHLAWKGGLR